MTDRHHTYEPGPQAVHPFADVPDSHAYRFAKSIVQRLVEKGHIAYFAGGCVRDFVMRLPPSDFDVATTATPDEIRRIFGYKKTLAIGAAFGVICVVEKIDGQYNQVEVATFRSDGEYLDGRRPDSVCFTTPDGDAQRRDFTINGLFFDPIKLCIVDFVDGMADIQRRVVRAIGDPHARFGEDKLRLLRAVRFASRFDFDLDEATKAAVQSAASEIRFVSPERIAAELRKMLAHDGCVRSLALLEESMLLGEIFPELMKTFESPASRDAIYRRIASLELHTFESVLGVLVSSIEKSKNLVSTLRQRWRLSNEEANAVEFAVVHRELLQHASSAKWSELQPILISPHAHVAMLVASSWLKESIGNDSQLQRCRDAMTWSREKIDPPYLIDGQRLQELKVPTGPAYSRLIKSCRNAQLDGIVVSFDEAVAWLKKHFSKDFDV